MSHYCHTNIANYRVPIYTKAILIGIGLNVVFILIEAIYGFIAHSSALLSDAAHNLGDVLVLSMALLARYLLRFYSTKKRTYGWRGVSLLVSFLSSLSLIVILFFILLRSIYQLFAIVPVSGGTVSIVAGLGVIINFGTAFVLAKGRKDDININVAYLHMIADALISVSVMLSGLIIYYTGFFVIDPVLSIIIVAVIFYSSFKAFLQAGHLLLGGVPVSVNVDEVIDFFEKQEKVLGVHDIHVWAISTSENALTVHLEVSSDYDDDKNFLDFLAAELKNKFSIHHSTIQIEKHNEDSKVCPLDS